MNRSVVFPVILSGGYGTRLWPLSRELHPKQFIALAGEHTLLQTTARRLAALDDCRPPIVVCNEDHRFMVAEQLRTVGVTPEAILLEPVARNTAPAIAAAALEALARNREGGDPLLLVLPADHVIQGEERFAAAVRDAVREAESARLVTFGVKPAWPETGYGYIRMGAPTGASASAHGVDRFIEKPDAATARACIDTGDYFWNCGMFVFGAARYLRELGHHAPDVRAAVEDAHAKAVRDLDFLRLHAESFRQSPTASVDHAVMERTEDAVVVPLGARWSDIGTWSALFDLGPRDEAGNVAIGDVILEEASDTYVRSTDRLVAAVGVSNLVIVETADAVLVAGKGAAQSVREIAERLRGAGREEYRSHPRVYRPWGFYETRHGGNGFKVKSITVHPGQRLSLQLHRHRAEHWVVVRGVARVTRGEETFTLSANESTYIPPDVKHRLANPGEVPLELIEVQSGPYLGEDDIVRFEDSYGRVGGDHSCDS